MIEPSSTRRWSSSNPFVCVGGLTGYFMSFQFISPLRQRIVHPDTYRALQAMSQDEYDRRMEQGKADVLAAFERARQRSEDGEDHG